MATTPIRLMTFAEFEQLPDDPRGWRQELRHGEVFLLPPAKYGHNKAQQRSRRLLEQAAPDAGVATTELGFRPLPDREYWTADVAWMSRKIADAIPDDGYFEGVPELVIEVWSPSNRKGKMEDRRDICLRNGAREFWVEDRRYHTVEVSTADGRTVTYKAGQRIPLFFAPGVEISVDAIFAA